MFFRVGNFNPFPLATAIITSFITWFAIGDINFTIVIGTLTLAVAELKYDAYERNKEK